MRNRLSATCSIRLAMLYPCIAPIVSRVLRITRSRAPYGTSVLSLDMSTLDSCNSRLSTCHVSRDADPIAERRWARFTGDGSDARTCSEQTQIGGVEAETLPPSQCRRERAVSNPLLYRSFEHQRQ